MHVVVDMLHAIAVIAVAFGAVAELHVGVVGVGDAADGAFVEVALALLDVLLGLFELDGPVVGPVGCPFPAAAQHPRQVLPEEDQVVQNGDHRQQRPGPGPGEQVADDVIPEQRYVKPGQPLHLQGKDAIQQHLHVRVQSGEGEEQGHVDIIHGHAHIKDKAQDQVQHHAQEIEHVEPGGAPLPLQRRTQPIIEKGAHHKPQQGERPTGVKAVQGDQNKGEQPPDLSMEHRTGGKHEHHGGVATGNDIQYKDDDVADGDVFHQFGNAEVGVVIAEPVQPAGDGFHGHASSL